MASPVQDAPAMSTSPAKRILRALLGGAPPQPPPVPAPYSVPDYPALGPHHVRDARLFSDRGEMFRSFTLPPGPVIGEVGVGAGWFSAFLIETFRPSTFVAFDLFDLHKVPAIWGHETAVLFEGKTHENYFRDHFAGRDTRVVLEPGFSHERLATYADASFDLLYIDAGHTYDEVKRDAEMAARKLRPDGILVFNDYTLSDLIGTPYGVVPAVNELIVHDDWQVIGFALQPQMFCDIAIRREASLASRT
jgi:SAM-dependent methyltransferase